MRGTKSKLKKYIVTRPVIRSLFQLNLCFIASLVIPELAILVAEDLKQKTSDLECSRVVT